ncbi:MAG: hypothetical protein ACAI25_17185 [Planctomycetota bacterium]
MPRDVEDVLLGELIELRLRRFLEEVRADVALVALEDRVRAAHHDPELLVVLAREADESLKTLSAFQEQAVHDGCERNTVGDDLRPAVQTVHDARKRAGEALMSSASPVVRFRRRLRRQLLTS